MSASVCKSIKPALCPSAANGVACFQCAAKRGTSIKGGVYWLCSQILLDFPTVRLQIVETRDRDSIPWAAKRTPSNDAIQRKNIDQKIQVIYRMNPTSKYAFRVRILSE